MIAEGELVFVDSFGLEQRVPVTLTAQSSSGSPLSWLVQPSNAIMVIFILIISLVPSSNPKTIIKNLPINEENESQPS